MVIQVQNCVLYNLVILKWDCSVLYETEAKHLRVINEGHVPGITKNQKKMTVVTSKSVMQRVQTERFIPEFDQIWCKKYRIR